MEKAEEQVIAPVSPECNGFNYLASLTKSSRHSSSSLYQTGQADLADRITWH